MDDQQQTPLPQPVAPATAGDSRHPRRARRAVAAIATTGLVAVAVGVGAGYAVGQRQHDATNSSTSSGTQTTTGDGSGGIQPIPGDGTWSSGGSFQGQPQDQTQDQTQSTDRTTTAAGSQLTGLVRIVSTMTYAGAKAAGTGMVLTSDGEVVTNHHVVEGSTSIKVKVMSTGKTYVAKVVGTDAKDDVAVLQLTGASGLSTVTTDQDGVSVGDAVTAVGDANGTVDRLSAAGGEVLALRQHITTQNEGTATGERLTGLMQISSDVVSGDSGGATCDSQGEVVGMTTAASSGGQDIVGYAVPIAKVIRIADAIEGGATDSQYEYGTPAFLGVGLDDTSTTVRGVYRGTPAAKAGIIAGDRITTIGTTRVSNSLALQRAVAAFSPGDSVRIAWTDADSTSHIATVTLAPGPVE